MSEIEYYENKPDDRSVFYLKKNGDVILSATLDADANEFIFDRDVTGICEPDFADAGGSALKSAKSLYAQFVENGEIDDRGTFALGGRRVPLAKMSRYTIVILGKSVYWTRMRQDESGIKIKDILQRERKR